MKIANKILARGYYGVCTVLLLSAPALAYLDPGTVSYVVSMIAGLFIAGGAALAIFRRKIKLFFQNLGKKKETPVETVEAQEADSFNPMDDVVDPMAEAKEDKTEE